ADRHVDGTAARRAQRRTRLTPAETSDGTLTPPITYADPRAMLRDRVPALRHANIYEAQRYRHAVSSTLVERLDAHTARAASNFQVGRSVRTGAADLFAMSRYRDSHRIRGRQPYTTD